MSPPRPLSDALGDAQERDCIDRLKLNATYFQNNFVRAKWIPAEQLTDLRNWHSPMIREWTYNGHTRAGHPVGLLECLPKRYSFVDILRKSKSASSLPPSFHRMPDMSPEHTRELSHVNKDLKDLIKVAEANLLIEKVPVRDPLKRAVSNLNKIIALDASVRKIGTGKPVSFRRSRRGELGIPLLETLM